MHRGPNGLRKASQILNLVYRKCFFTLYDRSASNFWIPSRACPLLRDRIFLSNRPLTFPIGQGAHGYWLRVCLSVGQFPASALPGDSTLPSGLLGWAAGAAQRAEGSGESAAAAGRRRPRASFAGGSGGRDPEWGRGRDREGSADCEWPPRTRPSPSGRQGRGRGLRAVLQDTCRSSRPSGGGRARPTPPSAASAPIHGFLGDRKCLLQPSTSLASSFWLWGPVGPWRCSCYFVISAPFFAQL